MSISWCINTACCDHTMSVISHKEGEALTCSNMNKPGRHGAQERSQARKATQCAIPLRQAQGRWTHRQRADRGNAQSRRTHRGQIRGCQELGSGCWQARAHRYRTDKYVLKSVVVTVVQLCDSTRYHWIIYFKWVNCVEWKLQFNAAIKNHTLLFQAQEEENGSISVTWSVGFLVDEETLVIYCLPKILFYIIWENTYSNFGDQRKFIVRTN